MPKTVLLAIGWVALLTTCRLAVESPPAETPAPEARAVAEVEPPPLLREFRGAWLSPVWRPDWPSRPGLPPDSQQAELRSLLDRAQSVGLNAIVLHVRTTADALYPTSYAPWSAYLSGERGRPAPYDPLAFAIAEAHRRGLELHAWFNPFRAAPAGQRNPRIERPEWVVSYATQKWIDPGLPEARAAVLAAILEVVDRYDIDGIHLDDYFYPYLETDARGRTLTFPDDASWTRHRGDFASRPQWRRANINDFVASLYREVKARKPWVSVGISPFGIWRPGHPAGITGLDAYAEIFADARHWLHEGWVDYLAPQLYWPIDGRQNRFTRLDDWWRAENVRMRHIWPGLHTERETIGREPWPAGEIERQIDTLRAVRRNWPEADGHIHFRMKAVLPLADGLRRRSYTQPAVTPAMPWLDGRIPGRPIASVSQGLRLRVQAADSVPVRWFALQVLGEDGEWQLILRRADRYGSIAVGDLPRTRAVAIRAISPTGVESAVTVVYPED